MLFADGKLPDAPGKATYVRVCGECHGADVVTSMRHDRAGWTEVVSEMLDKGAVADEREVKTIVAYLTKALPKRTR